ncbi:hypothetical protein STEG23_022467, partial [Scotinomys teguina]
MDPHRNPPIKNPECSSCTFYVHHGCAWCPQRAEESIKTLELELQSGSGNTMCSTGEALSTLLQCKYVLRNCSNGHKIPKHSEPKCHRGMIGWMDGE